ncbi:MAG: hypothetical protein ACI3Z8_08860 [Paludibacteraceae bacterium]
MHETANSDWGYESSSSSLSSSPSSSSFSSSFYSTSAYVLQSARSMSGSVVVGTPAGANSMAVQATYTDFAPQNTGMAQVNRFYAMADDMYEQYLSADAGQSKMYARGSRPDDGPTLGELTPVGDAVLPLLACVIAYAAFKIRRMINLKKAKTL